MNIKSSVDRLQETRRKAFYYSSSDQLGSVMQKSLDVLRCMIKSNADPEELAFAKAFFESERFPMNETIRARSVRIYDLTKSVEKTMNFIIDKERYRVKDPEGKMEPNDLHHDDSYSLGGDVENNERSYDEDSEASEGEDTDPYDDRNYEGRAQMTANTQHFECTVCKRKFGQQRWLLRHKCAGENADVRKPYKCDVCGKCYRKPGLLAEHMRGHADTEEARKPYKCHLCDNRFRTEQLLAAHIFCHDGGDQETWPFQCNLCDRRFKHKNQMYTHRKRHAESEDVRKPHKCNECEKRFSSTSFLKRHKLTHLPEDDPRRAKKYECDVCRKLFTGSTVLAHHRKSHEDTIEARKPFQCSQCGQRFTGKRGMQQHELFVHLPDDEKPKEECPTCGKMVRCILSHRKAVHEKDPNDKDKRPFKCEQCGKDFRREDYLRGHMKTQHADDDSVKKPFACDECDKPEDDPRKKKYDCVICGKTLANSQSFNKHKKSHSDVRPLFKCDQCDKRFTTKINLKAHVSTHTGEFKLQCQFCPRGFTSKQRWASHQECHDRGTNKVSYPRKHICTLCPRRFEKEFQLTAHLKRHEDSTVGDSTDSEADPDRFRCKLCGQTYTTISNLRGHVKIVHGETSKYYSTMRPKFTVIRKKKGDSK
ncbi:hypothetical protein PRIPAC_88406 [Pristionchus pacificus]|uniref:Zinc finger protein n=1 Tax=Pristionchus pacificus TaxID=54126 RepID=A0A2A6CWG6_PRIPA|nr:hypothetical protein PRIPAC_88406 [Pristionchus pacificus]|eukprot:PDM82535.1 zinc finger protein [Pristionchus pacificus]